MLRGRNVQQIYELHGQGLSIRAIARNLALSRNSVRKYLRSDEVPKAQPRPRRGTKLTPYESYVRPARKLTPYEGYVRPARAPVLCGGPTPGKSSHNRPHSRHLQGAHATETLEDFSWGYARATHVGVATSHHKNVCEGSFL
jgi:hypothetical protein